ncbi:kunitz-type serine protease inhibitor homolog delta-dendrotoxin-like [Eublepharis macularius]|uniref:Kunitz-like protein n=1 Tax=Eublepharis macularius TaxID=481883 RepID=A0A098LY28_EUBMA|nr:kunitz-type serine protease inhibitor homolog delta-dendrotoxin-like [Eublepharis macularius]
MKATILPLLLVGLLAIWAGMPDATEAKDICRLPAEVGPCLALIPRWFYNWKAKECQKFDYGGCGGNANNFKTLEECQRACGGRG